MKKYNIFKKKKLPRLTDIIAKRPTYVSLHDFSMIGRTIKYTTPELEDGSGVVLSDRLDLSTEKRVYTILGNDMETAEVPDSVVYQCSDIDVNQSIKEYDPRKMHSDINRYCSELCMMICQEECPLFKYKNKKV